jgi:hypothetical protein
VILCHKVANDLLLPHLQLAGGCLSCIHGGFEGQQLLLNSHHLGLHSSQNTTAIGSMNSKGFNVRRP